MLLVSLFLPAPLGGQENERREREADADEGGGEMISTHGGFPHFRTRKITRSLNLATLPSRPSSAPLPARSQEDRRRRNGSLLPASTESFTPLGAHVDGGPELVWLAATAR